jgi:uncharacterized CHY-type Zn-finger protein
MSYARPLVLGVDVDEQTRCAHWHSPLDIIAIKMRCCGVYYACKDCHDQVAGHAIRTWPRTAWETAAILCGVCGSELTIWQYMECTNLCPACGAAFNPGCQDHHHFYFEA